LKNYRMPRCCKFWVRPRNEWRSVLETILPPGGSSHLPQRRFVTPVTVTDSMSDEGVSQKGRNPLGVNKKRPRTSLLNRYNTCAKAHIPILGNKLVSPGGNPSQGCCRPKPPSRPFLKPAPQFLTLPLIGWNSSFTPRSGPLFVSRATYGSFSTGS
jgi:hypothetical protein